MGLKSSARESLAESLALLRNLSKVSVVFRVHLQCQNLGAKKEGAAGFFKGIGQGLAGVVAKPLTGVADLTSNTLAGIQSQLDSTVEVHSVRKPRVMDESPLQPYRERLAHAQDILWQLGTVF